MPKLIHSVLATGLLGGCEAAMHISPGEDAGPITQQEAESVTELGREAMVSP